MNYTTWGWWREALWRSVRTFCQTLLSIFGGAALNVWSVGWHDSVGVAAGAALISLLMSVDRSTATGVDSQPAGTGPVAPLATPVASFAAAGPVVTTACGDGLR